MSDYDPLMPGGLPDQYVDSDPSETNEWLESLDAVVDNAGETRARFLMLELLRRSAERSVGVPALRSTLCRPSVAVVVPFLPSRM